MPVAGSSIIDEVEAAIHIGSAEKRIDTVKRVGLDPFKTSANAVRRSTAIAHAA